MPPKTENVKADKTENEDDFIVGDENDDDVKSDAKNKSAKGDNKGKDLSSVEELAIEAGWNPDYDGEDPVSARDYILRGQEMQRSLRKGNKSRDRKIDDLQKGIENIKDYYHKLDETRASKMESEIMRLEKERDDAIEEGDLTKVRGLDKKIKSAEIEAEPLMDENTDNPLFDEWIDDNEWYGTDAEMTEYADRQSELEKYDGVPYKRVLKMIGESAKEMFADKFKSNGASTASKKKTKTVSKVEGTKPRSANKAPSVSDLDAEQKEIMKNILSVSDGLTQKEYLKGLQEVGEI